MIVTNIGLYWQVFCRAQLLTVLVILIVGLVWYNRVYSCSFGSLLDIKLPKPIMKVIFAIKFSGPANNRPLSELNSSGRAAGEIFVPRGCRAAFLLIMWRDYSLYENLLAPRRGLGLAVNDCCCHEKGNFFFSLMHLRIQYYLHRIVALNEMRYIYFFLGCRLMDKTRTLCSFLPT